MSAVHCPTLLPMSADVATEVRALAGPGCVPQALGGGLLVALSRGLRAPSDRGNERSESRKGDPQLQAGEPKVLGLHSEIAGHWVVFEVADGGCRAIAVIR